MFVIAIWAFLWTWAHLGEHVVLWREKASAIMLLFVGQLAMMLMSGVFPIDMSFFALPMAFVLTLFLNDHRRKHWIAELLLIVFLISAVIC